MKIKKIIVILLAICMLFALCACGAKSGEGSADDDTPDDKADM